MAAINFNRDSLPDAENKFEPIPAGVYTVKVEKTDVQPTKAGDGEYIKLTLKIEGPTHAGRILFATLNTRNKSAMAEQIGLGQLKSILTALNIKTLTDTDQMVGGLLSVKVAIKPASGDYDAGNEVKSYGPVQGNTIPKPATAPFGQAIPTF